MAIPTEFLLPPQNGIGTANDDKRKRRQPNVDALSVLGYPDSNQE